MLRSNSKQNCQALKIASKMHYNTLFQDRNLKNFLGRGTAPPQTLPTGERETRRAFGAPHLTLSALGFMRPVFSVPIFGNPNCD